MAQEEQKKSEIQDDAASNETTDNETTDKNKSDDKTYHQEDNDGDIDIAQ